MADDALPFHLGPDHEPGDIGQEEEWDIEGVAEPDEPGALVGRVDEQDPALLHGLISDHADGAAVDPGQPADQFARVELLDLEEAAGVDHAVDQVLHVEGHALIVGDEALQRDRGRWVGGPLHQRGLLAVLREVAEVTAAELDGLFLGAHQDVAATALGAMHAGAAHLLQGHFLADHHLGHAG